MAKQTPGPKAPRGSLASVAHRAERCRRCDLWRHATQVVFGAGSRAARLMLVGEQPGDVEDREGRPFVGPAGRLLREVLSEVGIDEKQVYLTNAVKHFKYKMSDKGSRRIHERPNREEILACRLWLDEEISRVRPKVIVALGATAAAALLGGSVKVLRDRGRQLPSPLADIVTVTVHPSSILRAPDSTARAAARRAFADDLRLVKSWL